MQSTVIYYFNNKIYVPTLESIEGGGQIINNPIYIYEFNIDNIIKIIKERGHITKKDIILTPSMWKNRKDPLLESMKVSNWTSLAKQSRSYSLVYNEESITLYVSKTDNKGRFTTDEIKTQSFDTNQMDNIANIIANDITLFANETNLVSSNSRLKKR